MHVHVLLQMMTSAIYGHSLVPAVLADEKGNVVRVEHAASPEWLEKLFRPVRPPCLPALHPCHCTAWEGSCKEAKGRCKSICNCQGMH